MKVVINQCYGGFGLSKEAILLGRELSNNNKWGGVAIIGDVYDDGQVLDHDYGHCYDLDRHDPVLVEVVEKLKDKANGFYANLKVIEIPDDIKYSINEYDGQESVHEMHRSWG